MNSTHSRRTQGALTALLLVAATAMSTATAAAHVPSAASPATSTEHRPSQPEARGFYDIRQGRSGAARAAQLKVAAKAADRRASRQLQKTSSTGVLMDIDGVTGTPRLLATLDGYLTGPSSQAPKDVALGYVADNLGAFGLASEDLDTFRFRDDYRDLKGTHHLSWRQVINDIPVFGYGLQASVNKNGRLLTIGGSPVPTALLTSTTAATLSADDALRTARQDLGETDLTPGPSDSATRVLLVTRTHTFAAWQTTTMSAGQPAVSVLDAATGKLLYRRPLGQHERAERARPQATGVAFHYFPKARHGGGRYHRVNYTKKGWLAGTARRLSGNNSHAYSDLNDNDRAGKREEVHPSSGHAWNYKLVPFHLRRISFCDNPYPCSWNPNKAYSWRKNRAQNTAQVFFFVNKFHDHLLRRPIGFTEDAGNFEKKNRSGNGRGRDAVQTQTLDGANTQSGLPDGAHIDNANMSTPPDGTAPIMQMYLQHQPFTGYPGGDPFPANNTGDEGDTVYHEYAHGLSNRLVIDPTGFSSLGGVQGGAMGEAWSDWYAFDFLVNQGVQIDRPRRVDVRLGTYDGAGQSLVRTEAIDCRVGPSSNSNCDGALTGHTGGYTYADYAHIIGGPEVHADGEIWGQALWDLRRRIGSKTSEAVVTRAMEVAPYNPSYLDMRNAILMADTAAFGGSHQSVIWSVFAKRGMGFYAGSLGGDDAAPAADFSTPPATTDTGVITGHVTDADSGVDVSGVPVTLAFQGANSVVNPTAITDTDGTYSLGPVPVGTYGKLVVSGAGYDTTSQSITVTAGGATGDFAVRRDWAATSGGGSIADFNGPDYGPYGCGPEQAIDGSQATGWGSTTGDDNGTPTDTFVDKYIVVQLPAALTVSQVGIDPAATCGDGGSASLADYRVELSANGTDWTLANEGTFDVGDRGRINLLTPTAGAADVSFVRVTMLSNQTPGWGTPSNPCPGGAYSGCSYTDLSEITVYGSELP